RARADLPLADRTALRDAGPEGDFGPEYVDVRTPFLRADRREARDDHGHERVGPRDHDPDGDGSAYQAGRPGAAGTCLYAAGSQRRRTRARGTNGSVG